MAKAKGRPQAAPLMRMAVCVVRLDGIGVFPPELAVGVPAEARAREDLFSWERVACGDDALPAVLCGNDLVCDSIQPGQFFKGLYVAI